MSKITELQIKIGADASGLQKELDKSQAAIKTAFSTKPINEAGAAISDVSKKASSFIGQWKSWVSLAGSAFGFADLIAGAVQAGDATYALTTRLGISAAEAGTLSRVLKLTGGDIDTCARSIMRLDKSFSAEGKSGDKTRATLEAYGVALTDVSGKLLPVNEQLGNLAKGYKAAKDAGQEQEFLMDTLGVKGMALAQTLDQYTEATKTASKVKSIGINPQEMHELAQQMQVMQMEAGQLKLAFTAAIAPIAKDIFPVMTTGLTKTAKLFSENKQEVKEWAAFLLELATAYKAIQFAKIVVPKVQETWNAAKIAVSPTAAREAAAQKEQEALAAKQEALIQKRTAEIERAYDRQRQAVIKTATRMNLSAEETATFIATKMQEIELKASETSEHVAMTMRAGFAQASQAAAASANETKAALSGTATSASASSTKVSEAHVAEAESAKLPVAAEKENAAAHGVTAAAAEGASIKVAEAHAVEAETAQTATVAEVELATATAGAGSTAEVAGKKGELAGTKASGAIKKTTAETKGLETQTKLTGVIAQGSLAKMEKGSLSAYGRVKQLASGVLLLATNWWLAVAAFAAYQGAKAASDYAEKKASENVTLRNGKKLIWENGSYYTYEKSTANRNRFNENGWTPNPGAQFLNIAQMGFGNDDYNKVLYTDIEGIKEANAIRQKRYENSAAGKAARAAEELKNQQARIEDEQRRIAAETAGLGDAGMSTDDTDNGSSKKTAKAEKPMRTKYSFEDDPELSQWANQIIYASTNQGIDPNLVAAVIKTESHGNASAISKDNAHFGLGQISQDISNQYGNGLGVTDPNWNIIATGGYLRHLLDSFGNNIETAVSAYNLGEYSDSLGSNRDYISKVMGYYNSMTTSQVAADQTTPKQIIMQVPYGEIVKEQAVSHLGEQWMDPLKDNTDELKQCASFASEMYRLAGVTGISHTDNGDDLAQQFKNSNAYHTADSGYTPQVGDLIDWKGHVGIYAGNGQYIARNSTGGVHLGPMSEAQEYGFGNLLGYGSISDMTGGATVARSMSASNQAALEAMKRQQELIAEKNNLMEEMQNALINTSGTAYQKDFAKLESDLRSRAQKINKLAGQGVDVSDLQATFQTYTAAVTADFAEKWQGTFAQFRNETRQIAAQARHDYEEAANAEYDETIRKLDKERKEKEKALMQDENDSEMRNQITDWYYAKRAEAEEKLQKTVRESHEKYLQYLEEEGNLAGTISYLNSPKGQENANKALDLKGQQEFVKQYVAIWQEVAGSTKEFVARNAANISSTLYSSMSEDLAEFIQGTKSAAQAFQDFGKSVLNMMAKIAAQRLAASWMTGILGMFGHRSSGMNVASGLTGGLITGNFSKVTSAVSSFNLGSTAFAHASGGYISGPGNGTSDDIPAWLSNGEFIMTAAATKKYQPLLELMNAGKFAEGGIVAPTISSGRYSGAVMPATDRQSGRAAGGVVVNIRNNSNGTARVEDAKYDDGLQKWVIDVVVDAASRNRGGFATNMKSALKGAL